MDIKAYLENLKNEFVEGLWERIQNLETYFLSLEREFDAKLLDTIIREIHSIKGAGGTHGLPVITVICHQLEDKLQDRHRKGIVTFDAGDFLPFLDTIQSVLALHQDSAVDETARQVKEKSLVEQLNQLQKAASIFYLDNSRTTKTVLSPFLERTDLRFSHSDDGYIALGRLVHEPFNLVLTANNLKTLPGRGVLNAVRTLPHLKSLPFVFIGSAATENFDDSLQPVYYIERSPDLAQRVNDLIQELGLVNPAQKRPA